MGMEFHVTELVLVKDENPKSLVNSFFAIIINTLISKEKMEL